MRLIILNGVMRVLSGAAALLSGLAIGGCALTGEGDEEGGREPEVSAVLDSLEEATARRDFAAVCALLSEQARRRSGGGDCAARFEARTPRLRVPEIELIGVRVRGDRASARVRTRAEGQAPVESTIELVRERGAFKVASLSS